MSDKPAAPAGFHPAQWVLENGKMDAQRSERMRSRQDELLENQNLLSPANRVRAIITKQALQEGWDCPFAMCCVR
jgi:type III restriction enzyme